MSARDANSARYSDFETARRGRDSLAANRFRFAEVVCRQRIPTPAVASNPNDVTGCEIGPIEIFSHIQRGTESCGTSGQVAGCRQGTQRLHQFDSKQRLNGADQHRAAAARSFGHGVETPLRVNRINVQMTGRAEHGSVALRLSASRMTGGVIHGEISFRFNDSPTTKTEPRLAEEELADQFAGDTFWGAIVEAAGQRIVLHVAEDNPNVQNRRIR